MTAISFPQDRLTRPQAAEYLGLRPSTLEADASYGRLSIPFYRLGSRIYYRRSELDAWLESRHVQFQTERQAA
jgi:excisionase family DNA binding protein